MMDETTKLHSAKELRFVTSPEQIVPFLDRIRDTKLTNDSDDQNDINENIDLTDELSKNGNELSNFLVPPEPTTFATSATNALPNIYEEYVNFIDLSVLNPIIDAAKCQRDRLIESEISEQRFCFCFCFCVSNCMLWCYSIISVLLIRLNKRRFEGELLL